MSVFSVSSKVTSTLALALGAVVVVNIAILFYVFTPRFDHLQNQHAEAIIDNQIDILRQEQRALDFLNIDWARWDDTYYYSQDGNQAYVTSNLIDAVFANVEVNCIYIFNKIGDVLWGGCYDLEKGSKLELTGFAKSVGNKTHPLLKFSHTLDGVVGLYKTSAGPMIVSSRPALKTDGTVDPDNPGGTIVMGRLLTESMINRISNTTPVEFSFPSKQESDVEKNEFGESVKILSVNEAGKVANIALTHLLQHENETMSVLSRISIADITGAPVLNLKFTIPKDISKEGDEALNFAVVLMAATGTGLLLMLSLLMRRIIIRPVKRLTKHIVALANAGDHRQPLAVSSTDELGVLAHEFNRFMGRLQSAEDHQREAEHVANMRQDELEKLNRQKDRFFSIIAHDLKSPFNALLGFSELLLLQNEKMDKAQVNEYCMNLNQAATQAYKLLEDLLSWSRLQLDRIEFEPELNPIDALIESNIEISRGAAAVKKIELATDSLPEVDVYADTQMLSTILRNVIGNAIKFTNKEGSIQVSAAQNDGFVIIDVTDNGIGMTDDKLSRLFVLGTNISTNGTEGETGTGLGLLLCKEMAIQNRGDIEIQSTENVGTRVRILMPTSAQPDDLH